MFFKEFMQRDVHPFSDQIHFNTPIKKIIKANRKKEKYANLRITMLLIVLSGEICKK